MQPVLTQRQIDLVRASIPRMVNNTPFNFYLRHVLVALPLYLGAKQQDMLNLRVEDVDLKAGTITFGKRTLPLHPQMKKLFRKYLSYRAVRLPDGHEHGMFLVRAGGKGNNTGRDGPEKFFVSPQLLLQYYRQLSGVSKVKITNSILRTTHGYHLALSGAPHTVIMQAMGCKYDTALQLIALASRTVEVDAWYMDAVEEYLRPYKDRL